MWWRPRRRKDRGLSKCLRIVGSSVCSFSNVALSSGPASGPDEPSRVDFALPEAFLGRPPAWVARHLDHLAVAPAVAAASAPAAGPGGARRYASGTTPKDRPSAARVARGSECAAGGYPARGPGPRTPPSSIDFPSSDQAPTPPARS